LRKSEEASVIEESPVTSARIARGQAKRNSCKLAGVTDPQEKRRRIGTHSSLLSDEAASVQALAFWLRTLYPD